MAQMSAWSQLSHRHTQRWAPTPILLVLLFDVHCTSMYILQRHLAIGSCCYFPLQQLHQQLYICFAAWPASRLLCGCKCGAQHAHDCVHTHYCCEWVIFTHLHFFPVLSCTAITIHITGQQPQAVAVTMGFRPAPGGRGMPPPQQQFGMGGVCYIFYTLFVNTTLLLLLIFFCHFVDTTNIQNVTRSWSSYCWLFRN
jgi:hypothetical protein